VSAKPVLFALSAACLLAADFWETKPFTEWTDRDVQRLIQNSPWSKQVAIPMGGQSVAGRGRRAGTARGGAGDSSSSDADGPVTVPAVTVTVRWESAMAIRQAMVKQKFGNEAGTAAEAKMALETPANYYILSVAGIPKFYFTGDTDEIKQQMLSHAVLEIKGKEPIKAVDFMTRATGTSSEGLFAFPRTKAIVEDDKEVEFTVRIAELDLRQRFRLKEMVVNGKLDL
jgi:hypothetical protein